MVEKYIQIGVAGLRAPDGTVQESIPIYAKASDANKTNYVTGNMYSTDLEFETKLIAKDFAQKFKEYVDGQKTIQNRKEAIN